MGSVSRPQILLLSEVAEMLRVSENTLRWWRNRGEGGPRSFKIGRRVCYYAEDVARWLDEQYEREQGGGS